MLLTLVPNRPRSYLEAKVSFITISMRWKILHCNRFCNHNAYSNATRLILSISNQCFILSYFWMGWSSILTFCYLCAAPQRHLCMEMPRMHLSIKGFGAFERFGLYCLTVGLVICKQCHFGNHVTLSSLTMSTRINFTYWFNSLTLSNPKTQAIGVD